MEEGFVVDSRRHLPHKQLKDSVLFITWRLAFELPVEIKKKLSEKRIHFNREIQNIKIEDMDILEQSQFKESFELFDIGLDKLSHSLHNLISEPYISILIITLKYDAGKKYDLYSYCIMSNHIHVVLKPLEKERGIYYPVSEITDVLKGVSAHKINKILGIKGNLWQAESYDRVVRDETEHRYILNYIIMNPVRAGLIENWQEWKGTFLDKRFWS